MPAKRNATSKRAATPRRKRAARVPEGGSVAIVFRPATPAAVASLRAFCEWPELPREVVSRRPLSAGEIAKLLGRGLRDRSLPVDVRVRLRGDRWVHLIPPDCIGDDAEEAALTSPQVNAVVVERLDGMNIVRASEKGASTLKLAATDDPDAPARFQFTSKKHPASILYAARSADEAVAATLRRLDAAPRALAVEQAGDVIRLRARDGRLLRTRDVQDVWLTTYVPVSERDGTIGPTLKRAIDAADPAAVRRAVRGGARLDYLVGELRSPLSVAMFRRRGRWLRCVQALIDAGAPIVGDGGAEEPAIVTAAGMASSGEASAIELIELLLSRGADLEARGFSPHPDPADRPRGFAGQTPLIVAAGKGALGIVMYLVARGADVHAEVSRGRRASAMPSRLADYPRPDHAATREFLESIERGAPRPTVARAKRVARAIDAWRAHYVGPDETPPPFAALLAGRSAPRGRGRS